MAQLAHYRLLFVTLNGLLVRILFAVWIYDPSLEPYHGGDYTLYRIAGEEILEGDWLFTNNLYTARPPLFPLMVALLGVNPTLILGMNILLATLTIPLTYYLAQKMGLAPSQALIAAALVALDPTSIKYAGVLLPEPLANLLILLFLIFLWRLATSETHRLGWALSAAVVLVLSAYTRPAAYLLWIPATLWLLMQRSRSWTATLVFVAVSWLGMQVWQHHNIIYFDNDSFTTIGTYNLLYYRAASVEHQATGKPVDAVFVDLGNRVEARLGNDTTDLPTDKRRKHLSANATVESAMTDVAFDVFLKHPLYYLLTFPVGVYRVLLKTSRLGPFTPVALIWNMMLFLGALLGIGVLLWRKQGSHGLLILLIGLYFVMGTLLVMNSGIDTRARSMLTPIMAIAVVYALPYLRSRLKRHSSLSLFRIRQTGS